TSTGRSVDRRCPCFFRLHDRIFLHDYDHHLGFVSNLFRVDVCALRAARQWGAIFPSRGLALLATMMIVHSVFLTPAFVLSSTFSRQGIALVAPGLALLGGGARAVGLRPPGGRAGAATLPSL